jgi:hypothetical protein
MAGTLIGKSAFLVYKRQSFAFGLICSALSVALGADYMENFQARVELSLVNWVEFFCNYMDDFNPWVEILYIPDIDFRNKKKQIRSFHAVFL